MFGADSRSGRAVVLVAVLVFLASAPALLAQDWTQLKPAHVPPARQDAAMAQFGNGSDVVMFGGRNIGSLKTFGETWIWNGSDWAQYTPSIGSIPPARFGATMAYDPVSGKAVLFGGADASGNVHSDTWIFGSVCFTLLGVRNCSAPSWTNVTSAIAPPARAFAGMAYDPARGRIVLNGGENKLDNLFGGCGYWSDSPLTDTWEFDASTNSWTKPTTVFGTANTMSGTLAQCTAGSSSPVMEFGGFLNQPSNDAFVYSANFIEGVGLVGSWTSFAPATKPAHRHGAGMAFYPVSGQDVLFGGETCTVCFLESDTWSGNCAANTVTWRQLTPVHNPGPRCSQAMATGANGLTVLLFGGAEDTGTSPNPDMPDTWVWGLRAACLPADSSTIPANSKVTCQFTPAEGIDFLGWEAAGLAPVYGDRLDTNFEAVHPGDASITARWADADGIHSSTLHYTIEERRHR